MNNSFVFLKARLKELEKKLLVGSAATVALIVNSKLFVANTGDSGALICQGTADGDIKIIRLEMSNGKLILNL